MEIGLFTEFEWRSGQDEARVFETSLAEMTAAEDLGFGAIWLAEIHFQKGRSVLSSPLIVAPSTGRRSTSPIAGSSCATPSGIVPSPCG